MKWLRALFALVLLATVVAGVEVITWFWIPAGTPRTNVTVFIPPQSSVRQMAVQLKNEGVIVSPSGFRWIARLKKMARSLKPGEYVFHAPAQPFEVLKILQAGKVVLHKVTFPEGSTLRSFARLLHERRLVKRGAFDAFLNDADLRASLGVPGPSFEGFLFPDTYFFSRLDGDRRILETLVARFHAALDAEDRARATALGFDLNAWVTFASILEKETGQASEYSIISSVFHNRLKKRMRLQSDPTVIYGVPDFNGNLTRKDLETPTPFNTYTRAGLPPHPIASPGSLALHAAVNPSSTDFLYFVARRDGSHVFAATYEEHLRNVAIYQLRRK